MTGLANVSRWGFPALTAILLGTSVYSRVDLAHERRQTQDLVAANTALRASMSQMQNQLQVVSDRLNQVVTQPPAPEPLAAPQPTVPAVPAVVVRPVPRVRTKKSVVAEVRRPAPPEDPRWSEVQSKLSDQQQQLENARQEIGQTRDDLESRLSSTHDELNGSIAKNRDQLVALQKQGERNYYEFEIDKSKQFQKVGPLSVSLRKVNQKHKYYDLALIVDDQQLEKKHVNLYEPMMFSTSDRPQPLELVVNEIQGNMIRGYISEPKYKKADLAMTRPADAPPVLQQR